MKHFIIFLTLGLHAATLAAQDTVVLRQLGHFGCIYLESPVYIVNKNYVVYQDCHSRKIIYPDMASFRIPQQVQESGIAMDRNGIYFRGNLLRTDTTGFALVGKNNDYKDQRWLWKTATRVYSNETVIQGADPASFAAIECFNGAYFKDKNAVYYFDKKIPGSDGATVSKSCSEVCYDKNQLYQEGKVIYFNGEKMKPVNMLFAKTKTAVIYAGNVFPGLDAATVKALSGSYVMDKAHVYYGAVKIPVRPEDLKKVKVWQQVNSAYLSDGTLVYAGGNYLQKELDGATFGMLPHSDFYFDKKGVYERKWMEQEQKSINHKFPFRYTAPVSEDNTFITPNSMYIVYGRQAYNPWAKELFSDLSAEQVALLRQDKLYLSKKDTLPSNDSSTVIGGIFTRQNGKIFYRTKQLSYVDAPTFTSVSYMYAKDKNHVYRIGYDSLYPLKHADAASFEPAWTPFTKDSNKLYYNDEEIIASQDAELLAIYGGYRPGCGLDKHPSSNYYLFRNDEGFWLTETGAQSSTRFLGKTFNPGWNKVFENFELAP